MDIGLDGPADAEELCRTLGVIQAVADLCAQIPDDPAQLGVDDSKLSRLMKELPDPPVDPRLSLLAGLAAANGCLSQVARFIENSIPTTPVVLQSLLRTALLGAARVVFSLGPEKHDERVRNTLVTMRQETASLLRLYNAAEQFQQHSLLVPPAEVLEAQRRRAVDVIDCAPRRGESATLEEMAHVVGQLLVAAGYPDITEPHSEHIAWTFNVYSGVAHGFGWPRLVLGTRSMPGNFIAELSMVASTAHLASDLVISRSRTPGGGSIDALGH